MRKPLLTLVCAVLLVMSLAVGQVHAATKSRTTPLASCSSRCISYLDWPGNANGAIVSMIFTALNAPSGTNIVHWIQLSDSAGYFVQIGYERYDTALCPNSSTGYSWFWRDNRPNGGGNHIHCISWDSDGSQPGGTGSFQIWRESTTSSNYDIYIVDSPGPCNGNLTPTCVSTNNATDFNDIKYYTAISGNGSFTGMPAAHWTSSQWQRRSDNTWHLQTADGTIKEVLPPYMSWSQLPSNDPGGDLRTCDDDQNDCQ